MSVGGAVLRFGGLFLRILQLCCAGAILGIYSYFLSVLADRDIHIDAWKLAVEGLSGGAVVYILLAILFVLCLGGNAFIGFLIIFFDLLFIGAFIAIAWFARHGVNSCNGTVNTPLGTGLASTNAVGSGQYSTYFPSLGTACKLNTAVFALAIIAIFLFLVSAIWQVLMVRHHKKEKRYGPGPKNNYTKGSGSKLVFWKRGRNVEAVDVVQNRRSGETETTVVNPVYRAEAPPVAEPEPKYGEPGYGNEAIDTTPPTRYEPPVATPMSNRYEPPATAPTNNRYEPPVASPTSSRYEPVEEEYGRAPVYDAVTTGPRNNF